MLDVAVRPAPVRPAARARRTFPALPWALVAAAVVVALLWTGTPALDVLRYAAYLALVIVLPGTLVHRLLRGSRGNLPEDLGFGAAVGLVLQLLVWAVAPALLRWYAIPVLLTFALVPGLRRHWRIADPEPLPAAWSWLTAGALLLILGAAAAAWARTPLPPAATDYYPDLMYHLALVHEMTRSMPFEVPQLAGDTLRYHFLSDADMAAGSLITGVSPAVVLLRLWTVPIAAVAVLVVAGLTRDLTGRWWAGPVAAGVAFAGLPPILGTSTASYGGSPISYASPSQTYAMPLLALLVTLAVDVLRGRSLRAAWVLVPLLGLACAGAKSSALPPFAAGLVAALAVLWWRDRRPPWAGFVLLAVTAGAMAAGLRLFAGGGAGTLGVQPLSLLRWTAPYSETFGRRDGFDAGGFLPRGLQTAGTREWVFVAGVAGWWLLTQSPRLLGLAALRRPGSSSPDGPVRWLLGGMVAAGAGAAWLLWHPSASQLYFYLCAAPLGVVLTVWLVTGTAARWRPAALGLAAGALWAVVAPGGPVVEAVPPGTAPDAISVRPWIWALAEPMLLAAVVAALTGWLAARRWTRAAVVPALVALALGASLGTGAAATANALTVPAPEFRPDLAITRDEMTAALWLDRHAGRDDVVATNVHCRPIARETGCDARAFWVAGLGGRRTVVESWGYSDATVAANGAGGRKYYAQPAPDPALFARNQRVFTDADPAALAALRASHGVRWLFADTRATAVSPGLAALATPAFTAGPVTVYEVRGRPS